MANNSKHEELSRALAGFILDFPDAVEVPEIAAVRAEDCHSSIAPVWEKIVGLQKRGELSVTSLVSALPPDYNYDLFFFQKLREESRHITLDDMVGISKSLRNHSGKVQLDRIAAYLAKESRNGRTPAEIAHDVSAKLEPFMAQDRKVVTMSELIEENDKDIEFRAANPTDIWGIPYAFPRLSKLTGGKQLGELIGSPGEPKLGKSYFWLQDAFVTSTVHETGVLYWCGEMKQKQLLNRIYKIHGVNGRNLKTGRMTEEDKQKKREADALLQCSPLYFDDQPLELKDVYPLVKRYKETYGISQFVLDYAMKIRAPGKDETEQTARISGECKDIVNRLDLAGILVTSVNKEGMDINAASKKNIRGSGQQVHDFDVMFTYTKFNGKDWGMEYGIMPADYERVIALWITAGRELDQQVEGGFIPYMRGLNSPEFHELEKRNK